MAEHFTTEQIEEFREAFSLVGKPAAPTHQPRACSLLTLMPTDKDGDGTILITEVGSVLRLMGVTSSDGDIKQMHSRISIDSSGQVDFPDFLRMMVRPSQTYEAYEQEVLESFRSLDHDGNGLISVADFRQVMQSSRFEESEQEVDEMLCEANVTGDVINYTEFVRMMLVS